jgi:hypothetical protein
MASSGSWVEARIILPELFLMYVRSTDRGLPLHNLFSRIISGTFTAAKFAISHSRYFWLVVGLSEDFI